ncbi:MAG TPA: hypothetical protein VJ302_26890 [Blastocatellia bacterium]|nr:hypothetical protein [Blastocatellia bacterium]
MPNTTIQVKTKTDSNEVLERLQGLLKERDRCLVGCERLKTSNGAVYADYLVQLGRADVQILDLVPEAFKLLVEIKAEITGRKEKK